jgi:hypothetical protein
MWHEEGHDWIGVLILKKDLDDLLTGPMGWRFFKLGEGPSVRFHSPHDPAMMDMQFNLEWANLAA